ncbi:MAG: hypothetical protein HY814_06590 [Candidatus Riflebacteria bacterium]|nr:hypothetical protein [Candidatus Riflebacteria bacterium]
MSDVSVKSRVETVTRTELLGRFLQEVTKRLTGYMSCFYADTIAKGVIQRQYIGTILISYLKQEKLVGRVRVDIDYHRHRFNIEGKGVEVSLDPGVSVASQVSPSLDRFLSFFARVLQLDGVTVELSWYWYPGIDVTEANRWMNARDGQFRDWLGGGRQNVDNGFLGLGLDELDRDPDLPPAAVIAQVNHTPGALDEVSLHGQVVLDALQRGRKEERDGE